MNLLLAALLLAPPQEKTWDPARTWVFAVGVLEWKASQVFGSFPKEGRRDAELMELLKSKGVPADHVVFIKDGEATRAKVEKALAEHVAKAKVGDLLIFYYAGHGCKADSGATYFANYDATGDVEKTGWPLASILDTIEARFKGSRALLTADCCYSGSLADEAKKRKGSISYACLTSSLASTSSTGNWTFTEALLKGFRGDPVADLNGDGAVELGELGRFTEAEMAFADGQLSTFATFGKFSAETTLADAGKKAHPRIGERLEVEEKKKWYRAKILEVKDDTFKIHYVGWDDKYDEWVGEARTRPYKPVQYEGGTKVEVEWKGKWYPSKVLQGRLGLHLIHYDGFTDVWDEWVSPQRIRRK